MTAAQLATDIYVDRLFLTEQQRKEISQLHEASRIACHTYRPGSDADQLAAASWLAASGLDLDARKGLGNRWSSRWSQKSGQAGDEVIRKLYQWSASSQNPP